MTDGAHASGWWQASDGKWYPPETRPTAAPPDAGAASTPTTAAGTGELGPLASTLLATGIPHAAPAPGSVAASHAPPTGAPVAGAPPAGLAPPTAPPAAPPPKPEPKVRFDADGWIMAEERAPAPVGPPPPPPWKGTVTMVVAIAVAVLVVGAAAVVFIPRGSHRPSEDAIDRTPTSASDGTDTVDPLTLNSVLSKINVRFSDVGNGYEKAIDGSIDPIGGDSCTQPQRPFAPVGGTHWAAYIYSPTGLGGMPLGHLAASVTVFDSTAAANKRQIQERTPEYQQCLSRWDRWVWFADEDGKETRQPTMEAIAPIPMSVEGAKPIAYRYVAGYVSPEGRPFSIYTDNIIFTKGRVRVWIEVSSGLVPFDEARRNLLVSRLSQRVDEAIA